MPELVFNQKDVRELQRQCLHHNVFPPFLMHCMNGKPPKVFKVLSPMVNECIEQLSSMSFENVNSVVQAIPSGLRMMVEPVEEPFSKEYLRRVAEYCIATEVDKGYSPVSDVVNPHPEQSHVLEALPELRELIDKRGLLQLTEEFTLMDGGIRYRDHVLHYHQFLRRGFSSNPNFDFLGTLARYRNETGSQNSFRIAIDHRRIMNFTDYRSGFEKDGWYGPRFNREKLDDPKSIGLTVIERLNPDSLLDQYPVLKTEFLWKTNEGKSIKSLEIEELNSPKRPYDNWHINRYLHAERDMENQVFRHFDGAAKVYPQDSYAERFLQTMPTNTPCQNYIKLFRIDGQIDLDDWLSLIGMFYKGNEMIIQYFDPERYDEVFRPLRENYTDD